ncbi:hypothetical protein N136_01893 [Leifsonia aquatica ATCC 14665]|uniref:Uncharacterized protein n=1 Tax=Leifsonia aquatica ATCC 14665 TaxID=1358026 RepID=U2TAL8_LEIAQ|nr:hypothetical protein N136_01893 [Leifsonia aquatica ATCC 14665]
MANRNDWYLLSERGEHHGHTVVVDYQIRLHAAQEVSIQRYRC